MTWWNKTNTDSTFTRRTVQLNCSATDITYQPFYFYELPCPEYDLYGYDRCEHDNPSFMFDTGQLLDDLPTDAVQLIYCNYWVQLFFGESVSFSSFTWDNAYYHYWYSTDNDAFTSVG